MNKILLCFIAVVLSCSCNQLKKDVIVSKYEHDTLYKKTSIVSTTIEVIPHPSDEELRKVAGISGKTIAKWKSTNSSGGWISNYHYPTWKKFFFVISLIIITILSIGVWLNSVFLKTERARMQYGNLVNGSVYE